MTPPGEAPSPDDQARRFLQPGELMMCFACREVGVCQFGLRSVEAAGERAIVVRLSCPERFEGGPRVAHGGWTAAVMDESLGHLGPLNGALTVTGSLNLKYLKPVPVGRALAIRAWVVGVEGRRWSLAAEMTLAEADGPVLARAEGVFVERRADHFQRSQDWLAGQPET